MNAEYIFLLLVFAEKEDVSVLGEEPPSDAPNITGYVPGKSIALGTDLTLNCSVRGGNPPVDEVIFICTGPQTVQDAEDVRYTDENKVTTVSSLLQIIDMTISILKYVCECHAVWNGSTSVYNATTRLRFNPLAFSKSKQEDDDDDIVSYNYLAIALGCVCGAFLLLLVMLLAFKAKGRGGQGKAEEVQTNEPNKVEYIIVETGPKGYTEDSGDSSQDQSGTTMSGGSTADSEDTESMASGMEGRGRGHTGTSPSLDSSGTGFSYSSGGTGTIDSISQDLEARANFSPTDTDTEVSTTAPLIDVLTVQPAALEEASRMRHRSDAGSYASESDMNRIFAKHVHNKSSPAYQS